MTADFLLPPGLILILAGLLLLVLSHALRNIVLIIAPLLVLWLVWQLPDGNLVTYQYLGFELTPLAVDPLARLFATVFAIAAATGGLFAFNQMKTTELASAFVYAGSAIGVVFAGDLITVFVFWEVMAIASTLVIWSGGVSAQAAGQRYAVIHFLGGVLLMAGIAGEVMQTGSIAFAAMEANSWPRWLILAGFLINAGAPPLGAWVSDAYPQASWSGTVFLSAFTTKTAVYVLMRTFPGTEILIYIGVFMIFYGIVYAILSNDIRRILAFSIISQVGYMVVGVGIGSETSLNGAATHAFVHIIYKALLLMTAGAVIYQTGKSKSTDLGGLFKTMPFTMVCAVIGALAISAFPWTSGYIAKSFVSKGIGEYGIAWLWFATTAASASAFLYVGIRYPWLVFFHKESGLRPSEPPKTMILAMGILAVLCVAIGVYPYPLYDLLPYELHLKADKTGPIVAQLQLLLFSGLAFFILLPILKNKNTIALDFDWFYRGFGKLLRREFDGLTLNLWLKIALSAQELAKGAINKVYRWHGPGGLFAESWTTGRMAFLTTVLLGIYLIVYFL